MTIKLKGHLDTSQMTDVKKNIDAQLAGKDATEHIVVDCSELDYISSSGLRILLAMKKQFPFMIVEGVKPDIYNVFEMTGFTRILDVRKALRKIDISNCQLLGEGGNGAVYRINDEEIVKVSKHAQGNDKLNMEREKVKEAFLLGMPTVISFDTVDCGGGRKGIVMEALNSQSIGGYINENPALMDSIVPKYAELLRQTNAIETNSPMFNGIKDFLRSQLYMPQRIINDEEVALLESLLDEVPDDNHLVHFDAHVGNVLMYGSDDDRNLMLIDLGDSGTGHPVFEVAGFAFMMLEPDYAVGCTPALQITNLSHEMSRTFCRRLLAEMFHVPDDEPSETLDTLVRDASLVGRLKSAFIAQRLASAVEDRKFKDFFHRVTRETITLVPEMKEAIRHFVSLYEQNP